VAGTAHRALIQAGVAVPRNYVTAMGKEVRCDHRLSISVKPDTATLTRHCSCAMILDLQALEAKNSLQERQMALLGMVSLVKKYPAALGKPEVRL